MEIQGDRPLDPVARRRQTDAVRGQRGGVGQGPAPAKALDATFSPGDATGVARLVGILRNMNPVDVHRVDELKARIADGSYRADPEELADLLLGQAAPRGPARR
jgi:flagellar biosynthesis anti-sigma factor FlgM